KSRNSTLPPGPMATSTTPIPTLPSDPKTPPPAWTLTPGVCLPGNVRRAAADPATLREPVVSDTDLRQGRVLGTGLAATIAAFAAAGFTVATGGVGAATVIAAVAAAAVSEPSARSSDANRPTIRHHFLTRSSPVAAFCFGSARGMRLASALC